MLYLSGQKLYYSYPRFKHGLCSLVRHSTKQLLSYLSLSFLMACNMHALRTNFFFHGRAGYWQIDRNHRINFDQLHAQIFHNERRFLIKQIYTMIKIFSYPKLISFIFLVTGRFEPEWSIPRKVCVETDKEKTCFPNYLFYFKGSPQEIKILHYFGY